jgi:hypothetical protein
MLDTYKCVMLEDEYGETDVLPPARRTPAMATVDRSAHGRDRARALVELVRAGRNTKEPWAILRDGWPVRESLVALASELADEPEHTPRKLTMDEAANEELVLAIYWTNPDGSAVEFPITSFATDDLGEGLESYAVEPGHHIVSTGLRAWSIIYTDKNGVQHVRYRARLEPGAEVAARQRARRAQIEAGMPARPARAPTDVAMLRLAFRSVARRTGAAAAVVQPGAVLGGRADVFVIFRHESIQDCFAVSDIGTAQKWLGSGRRSFRVESEAGSTFLASGARVRRLPVSPPRRRVALWPRDVVLSLQVHRKDLLDATRIAAGPKRRCLLDYRDGALVVVDLVTVPVRTARVDLDVPVLTRAVSASVLHLAARGAEGDWLQLSIAGVWNGAGLVLVTETLNLSGAPGSITTVTRGGAYTEVRHLLRRRESAKQSR